jgi:hypothetical protein
VSIFEYAGGGRWRAETDYWSLRQAVAAQKRYEAAAARFDPDHGLRRSRLHWPASPAWAHPS